MHSTLNVRSHKKMMAEEIEYPLENLQNLLLPFQKKVGDGSKEQEFSAIINMVHYQCGQY